MIAELFLLTVGCIVAYVLNALQPAEKQPLVFIPEAISLEAARVSPVDTSSLLHPDEEVVHFHPSHLRRA